MLLYIHELDSDIAVLCFLHVILKYDFAIIWEIIMG